MRKHEVIRFAGALALAAFVLPTAGMASSHTGGVVKETAFVCPVFNADSQAGSKVRNRINIANGDTSILPGSTDGTPRIMISVPVRATNGDGAGSASGSHSTTGDKDYTAIWNTGG